MARLSTTIRCAFFGVVCIQQLYLQQALHAGEAESDYVRQSLAKTLTRNEELFNEVVELQQKVMACNHKCKTQQASPLEADNQRLEGQLHECLQREPGKTPVSAMLDVDVRNSVHDMAILGSLARENPKGVDFVVGIPSVHRQKADYLNDTLYMLFRGEVLSPDEIRRIVVVVHLADVNGSAVNHQVQVINHTYFAEIAAGRLHVIHARSNMYPALDVCPPDCTFSDEPLRVKWRAKQNIDYAWLMDFSSVLGSNLAARFYIQLEDDIQFAHNWVSKALVFIDSRFPPETYRSKKHNARWSMIDFSPLGFIGKAFPIRTLPRLASHLRLHYDMMPCDLLVNSWLEAMLQPKRIQYFVHKGSLFTHVGVYRTLGGVQLLHEGKRGRKGLWDNPPAQVTFGCPVVSSHRGEHVYMVGDAKRPANAKFLWCTNVGVQNILTLKFDALQSLQTIHVQMATEKKPDDYLHYGVLEVASGLGSAAGEYLELISIDTDAMTDSIREERSVLYWAIDEPGHTPLEFQVKYIRLRATRKQANWLAILMINVMVKHR